MPELPEVETVARSLRDKIVGKRIVATERSDKTLRRGLKQSELDRLVGARITSVERHAKFLLMHADNGWSVLAHLGMTGQMLVRPDGEERPKHTHVVFALEGPKRQRGEFWFVDPRRFGQFSVVETKRLGERDELRALGPDPFSDGFTVEFLVEQLRGKQTPTKSALMDQKIFAGMGNIYVAEALFVAGISPKRLAGKLKRAEIEKLHAATRAVLTLGIDNRGTSISDYVDVNGNVGENEAFLQVYGREDEPCSRCGKPILRLTQAGRSTFYCKACQK